MFPSLSWISAGAGAVAAFALSFLLHTVDVNRIEDNHRKELAAQKAQLEQQCKDDQAITKGANDALQKNYNLIAGKLAAAKLRRPANCVLPASSEAIAATGGNGHAGQNGISTDWLYDYAAECETYRTQRIGLESFIDETWKAKGQ